MEKVLLLLLHAWIQVQANSFPHYFLHRNSTGIVPEVDSLLGYRGKHYLLLLLGYGGKPKLPSCHCLDMEENLNYLPAIAWIWRKT
jgi:hypothetical protein